MDNERTTLVDQEPQYAQPNMQQPYGQVAQPDMNQYYGQTTQPNMGQPYGQTTQPNMGQPYGQPNMGQPYGQTTQPNMGQPYGQTTQPNMQQPYGQPNMMGQPYGQPYGGQPMTPKPPRKPLSKNAKIGIISGIAGVAVLVLFFAVLLPLLTKSKLAGRYEYDNQWIICEDGVYVLGYTDWDYIEVGTYEIDDDEVEFTTAGEEYSTMYLKFNAKDNYLKDGGTKLKCKDKKATLDFEPNKEYIKNIEQTFQTATENVIASDSDIYESALDNWYFIYEDDFEDPGNDFEKALAKEMDYDNNECLQYMLTEAGLAVDIDIDSRGNVTVDAY